MRLIATTRTSKKRQKLLDAGADYVIATQEEDLISRVMEITSGHGADLIFYPIVGSFHRAVFADGEVKGREPVLWETMQYSGLNGEVLPRSQRYYT